MFHHANVDRLLYEWQLYHYDLAPYYGFPNASGYSPGAPDVTYGEGGRLNDIAVPDFPFYDFWSDNDYIDESNKDGPYTAKDVWDATSFLGSPYVYDTVLEYVKRPVSGDGDGDGNNNDDGYSELETIGIVFIVIACLFGLIIAFLLGYIGKLKTKLKHALTSPSAGGGSGGVNKSIELSLAKSVEAENQVGYEMDKLNTKNTNGE